MTHFRQALEITPEYAEAYYNLGVALAGRGQVDEAMTHYRKALKSKPDYAEAHNNLAAALAGRGQRDEAMIHLQKALEIKPEYVDARRNLSILMSAKKRVLDSVDRTEVGSRTAKHPTVENRQRTPKEEGGNATGKREMTEVKRENNEKKGTRDRCMAAVVCLLLPACRCPGLRPDCAVRLRQLR